jgi:hypothetical protein
MATIGVATTSTTNTALKTSHPLNPRSRSGTMLADNRSARIQTGASRSPSSQVRPERRAGTRSKRGRNTVPFQLRYPHHSRATDNSSMANSHDKQAAPIPTWATSPRIDGTILPLQCRTHCRHRCRPCLQISTRLPRARSSRHARAA